MDEARRKAGRQAAPAGSFEDRLGPQAWAKFLAARPSFQARCEAIFANDPDDPGLWSELRALDRPPPPPPLPADASVEDLVRGVEAGRRELLSRAADAIAGTLGDRGSFRFYLAKVGEVGTMPEIRSADSLLVPFRRTVEAIRGGAAVASPAAYFVKSVKNFDAEHGPTAREKTLARVYGQEVHGRGPSKVSGDLYHRT